MLTALFIISGIFIIIGLVVTTSNARYLISGYNMLSEKERSKIDSEKYIAFLKRFFIFLGISTLLIGLCIIYLLGERVFSFFITLYPLLAIAWFTFKSQKYYDGFRKNKYASLILIGITIIIGILLYKSLDENTIMIHNDHIEITGMYGEVIPLINIQEVTLVSTHPKIKYKSNGFAIGNIRKGIFNTESNLIKLIADTDSTSYLRIKKTEGTPIYFSQKGIKNEEALIRIQNRLKTFN